MKKIYVYTAIFKFEDECVCVEFPDLPDVNTFGNNVEHSLKMAEEALFAYLNMLTEEELNNIKDPSSPGKIEPPQNGFTSLVRVDMDAMKAKYSNRAVKKTLTIPEYLNIAAE